jgi:hypothetical protein
VSVIGEGSELRQHCFADQVKGSQLLLGVHGFILGDFFLLFIGRED